MPYVVLGVVVAVATLGAQRPTDLVNQRFTAEVTHVADGDTLEVLIPPSRKVRVRLQGVDAPERNEPFSNSARTFTRVLLFGRTVDIAGQDVDQYGRLVAGVSLDGNDASESLIAAGLGCTYHEYLTDAALNAALARARSSSRGFWAADVSQPACVAREARLRTSRASTTAEARLIGNVRSKVYHVPTCRNAGCPNCTRNFASRTEAEAAGFRAARDCAGH